MSDQLNPDRKNPAFLAQFLTETLYHIPETSQTTEEQPDQAVPQADQSADQQADQAEPASHLSEPEPESNQQKASTTEQSDKTEPPSYYEEEASPQNQAESEASEPEVTTAEGADEASPATHDKETEAPQAEKGIDYYGHFEEPVLILVNYPNQKHLITKDQLVLTRILQALQFDLKSIAVINIQKEQLTWQTLVEQLSFNQCLAFGLNEDFFPFPLREYAITQTEEGVSIIPAPAVETIAASRPHKKQLWQNLKHLFNKD